MKKPFLRSRKPQKKQKRLEKDIRVGWGNFDRKVKSGAATPLLSPVRALSQLLFETDTQEHILKLIKLLDITLQL